MKKVIYVAGAYSASTPAAVADNVRLAIRYFIELADLGFAPFCPHLFHFIEWGVEVSDLRLPTREAVFAAHPRPYKFWRDIDDAMVAKCDALLRLPNASAGADDEVRIAKELGIPVFTEIEDVVAWRG